MAWSHFRDWPGRQLWPDVPEWANGRHAYRGLHPLLRLRDEQEAKKTTKRTVNDVVLGDGSYKERIQKLLAIGLTSVGVAKAILELKKKSKKGWSVLGVSDTQVAEITKLAH